jgi:hypothetical protein
MTPSYEASVDALMSQLERQQETIEQSLRAAAAIHASASSPDHTVTVTLNQLGDITELTFAGGRHRSMPPAELSRIVIDTVAAAKADLRRQLADVYQKLTPGSLDLADVMSGDFDVAKTLRDMATDRIDAHDTMFATMRQAG